MLYPNLQDTTLSIGMSGILTPEYVDDVGGMLPES